MTVDGSLTTGVDRAATQAFRRALTSAVLAALLLAAAAAALPPAAAAYSVTQRCQSPPLEGAVDDCSGWHRAGVRLTWDWDPKTETRTSGCNTQTFTADTPPGGITQTCSVEWDTVMLEATTTIRIDQTPPVITGAVAERPPDPSGWWTRPVAFTFAADDQTSGVAGCDTVTYAGPDGAGVQVAGGCRDVAGNSSTATHPLDFDATPPSIGALTISRSGRSAELQWKTSPDAVVNRVVRSAVDGATGTTTLYTGSATSFTDGTLSRERGYRYTVTAFDTAGNAASATATTARLGARARRALTPADGARLARPPLLRWKRSARARYYNVQLFRGDRKILSAWPKRNRLQLRRSWRYGGRRHRLARGQYRWYVWPGRGARAERRYGKMIGSSMFRFRP